MKLQLLAQKAVATGFKILDDLAVDITLQGEPVATFDVHEQKNVTVYNYTKVLRGLRTSYDIDEIVNSAGSIIVTDVKFLLQGKDVLTDIDTRCLVTLNNEIYRIIPPTIKNITNSTIILQLRKV